MTPLFVGQFQVKPRAATGSDPPHVAHARHVGRSRRQVDPERHQQAGACRARTGTGNPPSHSIATPPSTRQRSHVLGGTPCGRESHGT